MLRRIKDRNFGREREREITQLEIEMRKYSDDKIRKHFSHANANIREANKFRCKM